MASAAPPANTAIPTNIPAINRRPTNPEPVFTDSHQIIKAPVIDVMAIPPNITVVYLDI
jgi:hypothetical protein